MKKTLSIFLCIVMMLVSCSNFSFALAEDIVTDFDTANLDYDTLFDTAFLIDGSWEDSNLQVGKSVDFYFRGKQITENYNSTRHFNDFDKAYNYYLSQNPDILTDVPVFIFAPGTYSKIITVRYSAIILGANAGITPNADEERTLDAMADGVAVNSARTQETVFTAGLTRTTRTANKDAKWSYELEQAENSQGKKADIKFIIDGVKITGSVGISQYDYSNRLYTDLKLNGSNFEYTPTGTRTTLTALLNSVVDDFSGSGANALFSARCNSMNKNDVIMNNVRLTNIKSSAYFLFNKFFRNLTIDGMYYSHNDVQIFGSISTGSTFSGSTSAKTAEYDQNIEIKNSIFYKNTAINPISLGNANVGAGYTKLTANIHHNFFYDAVYGDATKNYWGIFAITSANSNVEYVANITDNIIHQESTKLETLFNGNTGLQKSVTIVNFNRNKVTGEIDCIYPNTGWGSNYYDFINTSIAYDFSHNFYALSPNEKGARPDWVLPPQTHMANGYDYTTAPYYLDYDMNTLSSDFDIESVVGLGDKVEINGYDICADCSNIDGTITPIIKTKSDTIVEIFKDITCTSAVSSIDLSTIEKGAYYYLKITKGEHFIIGILDITTGKYSDITTIDEIDISKFNFPIITVNTENNAEIKDKENYVPCGVTISNTEDACQMENTVAGIRLRGNSTLMYSDKKAYRIKFDKKQDLFGMGKAKSWVLLANSFDKPMVRNAIAFALGQELGLEYTSEFQFVNVYINGDFKGLYLLCEQTQTGSTRVDVEENEDGKVDTGYLIEMTGNGDPDEDRWFSIDPVPTDELAQGVTDNWRDIIKGYLKTPELDVCTDEQVEFISEYVNDVNYAILTQDWEGFNALCDVESFAKHFLVNTILNNGDAGYQLYIYKKEDGGKIYAGPLWDFDQSSAASTHCGDTYNKWYTGTVHPWFDSFTNWPEFLKLAKSIYLEHYNGIQDNINFFTTQLYPENKYDFHANDIRWNSVEGEYWRIPETIKELKNYSANFAHLNMWFKNRIAWLDSTYNKVIVLPDSIVLDKQVLSIEKNTQYSFSVSTEPKYTDDFELNWESSDSNIVTVNNGVITAISNGTAIISATVANTNVSASCSVMVYTKAVTPDERLPKVVLNEAGNGVNLDMLGSWATRVYWGYIGEEEIPYTWFDDFRIGCGTEYNADFTPRADKAYYFTKKGYYRFVLKCIISGDAPENYEYKDMVYTFYYDGKSQVAVPSLTVIDGNTVQIEKNGLAVTKLYYGNIGQENVPYGWFNDFWGKALATKSYKVDFGVTWGETYTLTTKGFYNFVIVYNDADGVSHEVVYTVEAKDNIGIITAENGVATLNVDNVGGKVNKLYYGYIGSDAEGVVDFDTLKAKADALTGDWTMKTGKAYTLTQKGYYGFCVNYTTESFIKGAFTDVNYDIIYIVENK